MTDRRNKLKFAHKFEKKVQIEYKNTPSQAEMNLDTRWTRAEKELGS